MQPLLLLFFETNCWWKLVLVRYGPNPSCCVLLKHTGFVSENIRICVGKHKGVVSDGQYKSRLIAQLIVPCCWNITPSTKIIWCHHIKKISYNCCSKEAVLHLKWLFFFWIWIQEFDNFDKYLLRLSKKYLLWLWKNIGWGFLKIFVAVF